MEDGIELGISLKTDVISDMMHEGVNVQGIFFVQ